MQQLGAGWPRGRRCGFVAGEASCVDGGREPDDLLCFIYGRLDCVAA